MKKLLLFFGFLSFQAVVLYGQTLTGIWQGVLKRPDVPNGELRIVIKISTTEAGKLAATMYSIDRGAAPVPSSAVTANGGGLKMSFERIANMPPVRGGVPGVSGAVSRRDPSGQRRKWRCELFGVGIRRNI